MRLVKFLLCSLLLFLSYNNVYAKKVLRVANLGEPSTLDPYYSNETVISRIVRNMFIGLTKLDGKGHSVAGLAKSWVSSADGLTWTFKLRDAKWSNGKKIVANDFVRSWRYLLSPHGNSFFGSLMYVIKNAKKINSGELGAEELGVKAIDDETLEIKLEYSVPYLLELLSLYIAAVEPIDVVKKYGSKWTKPENIVVNGPYILKERKLNDKVILVKNPNYYDADKVKIDEIVFYSQSNEDSILKQFISDELDWVTSFSPINYSLLKRRKPEAIRISPLLSIYYLAVNNRKAPFNNVLIRKALSMSINREQIVNIFSKGSVVAYRWLPDGINNYGYKIEPEWKDLSYEKRLEEARKLLKQAGYDKNKPLKVELSYNTSNLHKRIMVSIASYWKELGVNIELVNKEMTSHYSSIRSGDYQIARAQWTGDYSDPQTFMFLLDGATADSSNFCHYNNSDMNYYLGKTKVENNLKKRADYFKKAEEVFAKEQPCIPLFYPVSYSLIDNNVLGFSNNLLNIHPVEYLDIKE